jgi:cytochrome P450
VSQQPFFAPQHACDEFAPIPQEGTAFFPGSSLAGNGLLVSDGATWQRQRQLSNPAFRKSAIETYAKVHLSAGMDALMHMAIYCA